jgi:hypothetical protein
MCSGCGLSHSSSAGPALSSGERLISWRLKPRAQMPPCARLWQDIGRDRPWAIRPVHGDRPAAHRPDHEAAQQSDRQRGDGRPYTKKNAGKLAGRLGRNATEGELYVAHFPGSNGAGRLISLAESTPAQRADEAFPAPAKANPSIFFDKGRPRSVSEVYSMLVNRYAVARNDQAAPAVKQLAAATAEFCAGHGGANEGLCGGGAAQRCLGASGRHRARLPRSVPQAVAPVVSALWTAPTPVSEPVAQAPQPIVVTPARTDATTSLFQDRATDTRAVPRTRLTAVNKSATCLNSYGERFLKRLRVASTIVGARTSTPRRLFRGRAFR